jgi:hypothetical protein
MPASPVVAYAAAAAIGLGMIVAVYGPGYVLGTSGYWDMPVPDHRTYLMGYRYFLHEPWHWPVFEARTLNVPHRQSIAFNDSLPLWALLHKAIATVIPPWRGYSARAFLGLWYAVASALQAVFGVANLRALGRRSVGATLVTAVFFVAMPVWTFRLLHASLYAQFLLLSALYFYLITPAGAPASRRLRLAQLVQLGVAALLNPYHTVMSLAVFAASLARARAWRAAIAWFAAGCAVVLAALALAGYFAPEAASAVSGFQNNGSNLLGPVLPRRSGWIGEVAWIDPTGYQYEGLCYLGGGLLVLAALVLPRVGEVLASARRHAALVAVAGLAAAFALSRHVYLGSHLVLAYPVPRVLHWIPDQFRAPGRFSWLPVYVLAVFLLSRGFERFVSGWRRLVLPALAIVQLVDVTADFRAWRAVTGAAGPVQLDVAAWRGLLAHSDEVAVFPAHSCNGEPSWEVATRIQYLASEQAVPINGVNSSRSLRDCAADAASLVDLHPGPRTLYVFVAPMIGVARQLAAAGMPCAEFGFGEVCHRDRAVIDALGWPPPSPAGPLAYGDRIELAGRAEPYLAIGWSPVAGDGRWTEGPIARLVFTPAGVPPADPVLQVEAEALLCGPRTSQDVDVFVGGVAAGILHFDAGANARRARAIPIRDASVIARPLVEIELRPRDSRSPHELGCNARRQRFGIHVRRLWIEPAGATPTPAPPAAP